MVVGGSRRFGVLLVGARGRVVWAVAVAAVALLVPAVALAGRQPVLAWSPSSNDFGQVTVNQTASQTFTLKNTGGSASSALKVALSGSSAFSVTSDGSSATSLGPGKSCTVVVQFAPTSTGAVSASLNATGNKRAATATASLAGTGSSAGHIYWANQFDGTIDEAPLTGGSATRLVTGQSAPFGVAVDASHIYWANTTFSGGTIAEAPLTGGSATTLVTGQRTPLGWRSAHSHIEAGR
jgi:hypothetical protein